MGFVMNHLGPALDQASLDTKIWILDHNYNLWGRAVDELSNEGVYKYVDGVAWHSYAGSPDAMTRVHNMFPEKHMYFTEGGIPAHLFSPVKRGFAYHPYGTNWAACSSAFANILRNWARCICVWNLLLDQDGRPDLANPPRARRPGGLLCINTKSQQITHSGAYYALTHYSKAVQRGARIFASSGDIPDIDHIAAQNPDGSRVLVVTNRSKADEQRVQFILGPRELTLALSPDSITSLVW